MSKLMDAVNTALEKDAAETNQRKAGLVGAVMTVLEKEAKKEKDASVGMHVAEGLKELLGKEGKELPPALKKQQEKAKACTEQTGKTLKEGLTGKTKAEKPAEEEKKEEEEKEASSNKNKLLETLKKVSIPA